MILLDTPLSLSFSPNIPALINPPIVSSNEDFTSMFQKVLERGTKIYAEEVHGKWFEIDSPYDLSIAEKYIDF